MDHLSPTTPGLTTPRERTPGRGFAALAVVALLIAAGLFVQRGVLRGAESSRDFTMVYASARQFALGDNPYDFNATFDTYEAAGGTHKSRDQAVFTALYPPMTYAVLAPLGRLDWPNARLAWLIINLLATTWIAAWLVRHRPRPPGNPTHRLLSPRLFVGSSIAWAMALWLGAAALHTALAFGQLSVVTLALMLPLLSMPRSDGKGDRWPWLSVSTIALGLLLTLAGALKPQLMVIIAGFLLCTPRWRAVVWGMTGGLVVTVFCVGWLQFAAPSWFTDWQEQLTFFAATGHANPTAENPFTYQMINLEPWLHRLWPDGIGPRVLLQWLPIGIVAIVGGVSAALLFRHGPRRNNHKLSADATRTSTPQRDDYFLLAMGIAAVLSLLVGYHRTYDAVLLVIPGLWVWRRLSITPRPWTAWLALAAIALFALPGPVALTVVTQRGWLPAWLTEGLWWQALFVPHHTLALVVMLAVLVKTAVSDTVIQVR